MRISHYSLVNPLFPPRLVIHMVQIMSQVLPVLSESLTRFYQPNSLLTTYRQHSNPTFYVQMNETTERVLLHSAVLMMMGCPSQTFNYNQTDGFHLNQIVCVQHLTPEAINSICRGFIQYSNRLKYIGGRVSSLRKSESTSVQNLMASIGKYLEELTQFHSRLMVRVEHQNGRINKLHMETSETTQVLTLLKLHSLLTPKMEMLEIVLTVFKRCLQALKEAKKNITSVVLDVFWQLFHKYQHEDVDSEVSQLILRLFWPQIRRYLHLLSNWLGENEINNPYGDIFVTKVAQNDYRLQEINVPTMFKAVSGQLFYYGSFIRTVYCFVNQQGKVDIYEYMNVKQEFKNVESVIRQFVVDPKSITGSGLNKTSKKRLCNSLSETMKHFQQNILNYTTGHQQLPYGLNYEVRGVFEPLRFQSHVMEVQQQGQPQQTQLPMLRTSLGMVILRFQVAFESVLSTINQKCSQYFDFRDLSLPFGTLPSLVNTQLFCIKKIVLMEQGDFIQSLIENIGDQLEQSAASISQNFLSGQVEIALKASNAKYLPKEQTDKIRLGFLAKDERHSGWEMLYIRYQIEEPLDLLFPKDTMGRYDIVFNFLWGLKRMEYLARKVWINDKSIGHSKTYHILKYTINQFLSNIQADTFSKIQQEWNLFLKKIVQTNNLQSFKQLHKLFLTRLQGITFISSKDRQIHSHLDSLTKIILKILDIQMTSQQIDLRDLERQLNSMLQQFNLRVKNLVHIHESFTRQLNDFYQ